MASRIVKSVADIISGMLKEMREFQRGMIKGVREHSVEVLQLQYLELTNAFLTIVMGGLVGVPGIPLGLSMELARHVKDEVRILETRHMLGGDVIGDYFSSLGGEW